MPGPIAFLHPDLGLGGAERLIVDAAEELASRGHEVEIWTAHHDPARCFAETLSGRFVVRVAGGRFPRSVGGGLFALCAWVRCVLAALALAAAHWRGEPRYEAIVVDQVSVVVPLLRFLTQTPVVFYCHFPDLLLSPHKTRRRVGLLRRVYRSLLDRLEESSTGAADLVLVNSAFTRSKFAETFRKLHARGLEPLVLHPAVALPTAERLAADALAAQAALTAGGGRPQDLAAGVAGASAGDSRQPPDERQRQQRLGQPPSAAPGPALPPGVAAVVSAARRNRAPVLLSINRFERKKDLALAVRALAALPAAMETRANEADDEPQLPGPASGRPRAASPASSSASSSSASPAARDRGKAAALVVAGGFDPRLAENASVLRDLTALAEELGVSHRVAFVPGFADAAKGPMLAVADVVLYTPQDEHFGIVPLEAGAAARAVVAVRSGGPTETVVPGLTGELADPTPRAFAAALARLLVDPRVAASRGAEARSHVRATFGRAAFGAALDAHIAEVVRRDAAARHKRAAGGREGGIDNGAGARPGHGPGPAAARGGRRPGSGASGAGRPAAVPTPASSSPSASPRHHSSSSAPLKAAGTPSASTSRAAPSHGPSSALPARAAVLPPRSNSLPRPGGGNKGGIERALAAGKGRTHFSQPPPGGKA